MVEREKQGLQRVFRISVHDGIIKTLEVVIVPDIAGSDLYYVGLDKNGESEAAVLRLCTIPAVVLLDEFLPNSVYSGMRDSARTLRDQAKFGLSFLRPRHFDL